MYVQPKTVLLATAVLQIGANGQFNGAKCALFTNDVQPNRNRVLADFTITDFGGLTNLQAIVWGTPFVNGNEQGEVRGAVLNWLTDEVPDPAVTAYGYVITNAAGTGLLLAERFAAPFVYSDSGQLLAMAPRLVFDT